MRGLDILPNEEQKQLLIAVICSILLHSLLLTSLKGISRKERPSKTIEVELIREKKQIVSNFDNTNTPPLKKTKLLSDQDSAAVVEQVRRGFRPKLPPPTIINKPEPKKQTSKKQAPVKVKELKKEDLFLKNLTAESAVKEDKGEDEEKEFRKKLQNYKPFSRNFQSFSSNFRYGNPDFLDNIQDGEITLLNAKAHRHAIFVRRVALQVFGSLRRFSWQELSAREINNIRQLNVIHARLSKSGELKKVTIKDQSGSQSFDLMVRKAAENGAWDKNPPEGVTAEDGDIHFIFKARSWARNGGGNGLNEQRWLLLSTGLL